MDTTPTTSQAPEITAVRRQVGTSKGEPKYAVTITIDGKTWGKPLGGARAGRAQALVIYMGTNGRIYHNGLRQDFSAAEAEARKLTSATSFRHGGATFPVEPKPWAVAVPVWDEEQADRVASVKARSAETPALPVLNDLMGMLV